MTQFEAEQSKYCDIQNYENNHQARQNLTKNLPTANRNMTTKPKISTKRRILCYADVPLKTLQSTNLVIGIFVFSCIKILYGIASG